ncbi:YggT family protein [Dehalococcoides mccartyi]|nr:YggT family protein [Dehalococcoides mccartyi]
MSNDFLIYIGQIIQIFVYLVVARSLSTWFPNARQYTIVQVLYQVTDPVMVPASRLIPRIGMIDISPMIVILLLITISRRLIGE